MSLAWLCQIDAQLRGSGTALTIRLASDDNDVLCHHNGQTWWPAIARLPVLRRDYFDGDFGATISAPEGDIEVAVEGVPGFATATLAGARIRLWSTDNFGAASVDLRFDGLVDAEPTVRDQIAAIGFRVDDRWLDEPLLPVYAGTGEAEGDTALKGQVKPLLLGAPRFVEGVPVNTIDTVLQVSVGPIAGIDFAREDCVRFPTSAGDHASYAALVAATISPGYFATCLAEGLVRHGAPADGLLTYDVQGFVSGTQPRRAGAILTALAARQGHSAKIDSAAMTAIDTARPWNISLALKAQVTLRELAQRIAASINAVAIVRWTGTLALIPIDAPAGLTESGTLAADGSALPPVAEVAQLPIAAPFWRLAQQAEVTQRVHTPDEIRFFARINQRGLYDPAEVYREGDLVNLADGSLWLYTAVTPTSGNLPATGSAFWNASSPPLFNPRGDYVPATLYYPGDTVVWTVAGGGDGGGYRRIGTGPTDFTPPSNTSFWVPIVESGQDGVSPPIITLATTHNTFRYDADDAPLAQTTTLKATRQNTAGVTEWQSREADGTIIHSWRSAADMVTSTSATSSPDNDTLIIDEARFDALTDLLATTGLIFEARISTATGVQSRVSLVKVEDGANGDDAFVVTPSVPAIAFATNSAEVIDPAGQLPFAIQFTAKLGGVDVTASTTWGAASVVNCAVTNSGGGAYSLTSASARTGSFTITATYSGRSFSITVPFTKNPAGPAATRVRDLTLTNTGSATFVQVSDTLTINFPPGTTMTFSMSEGYIPVGGSADGATARKKARFMYRNLTDGGSWTQAGSDLTGSYAVADYVVFPTEPEFVPGGVSGSYDGLTPPSSLKVYEVRLDMLKDGAASLDAFDGIFEVSIS